MTILHAKFDSELYKQVKIAAVQADKTIAQWLQEAAKEKLEREKDA